MQYGTISFAPAYLTRVGKVLSIDYKEELSEEQPCAPEDNLDQEIYLLLAYGWMLWWKYHIPFASGMHVWYAYMEQFFRVSETSTH